MSTILTLLLALAGNNSESHACTVDRDTMLTLDFQEFDQDLNGGWRLLARNPGCKAAAADLIKAYRERNPSSPTTLAWHEGQLRAELGQGEAAISLFEHARKSLLSDRQSDDWNAYARGWNAYVDATVAFVRGDAAALRNARALLTGLPRPSSFTPEMSWPPNLDVVDGLIACFGKPYAIAYAPHCRQKPSVTKVPAPRP